MTKHDEGRRAFLVGTAIGAGAAASVALVPDALAKDHPEHHAAADAPAPAPCKLHGGPRHACHERQPWCVLQRRRYPHDDRAHRTADARGAWLSQARPTPLSPTISISRSQVRTNTNNTSIAAGWRSSTSIASKPTARHSASCLRTSKTRPSPRLRRARQPNSSGRRRRRFLPLCARTRWKACSPIRFTAVTETSRAGGWLGSPALNRSTHRRTCKAQKLSRASRLSACNRGRRRAEPWQPRKPMS